MMNVPFLSVVATSLKLGICGEEAITATPGMDFPCGSTILPRSLPFCPAKTSPGIIKIMIRTDAVGAIGRLMVGIEDHLSSNYDGGMMTTRIPLAVPMIPRARISVAFPERTQKGDGPRRDRPRHERVAALSELELQARVEEAAQRVVRAVEPCRVVVVGLAHRERRFLVEEVVDAEYELSVSRHLPGCPEIHVVEGGDLVDVVDLVQGEVGGVRQGRIRVGVIDRDSADHAPSDRDGGLELGVQREAGEMPPLGSRITARVAEVAHAVVGVQPGIYPLLTQIGTDEVDREQAGAAQRLGVGSVHVDAFYVALADVLIGRGDVAGICGPRRTESVTVDQAAQQRIAGGGALIQNVIRAKGADGVLDLDGVVVERGRETRERLRGDHPVSYTHLTLPTIYSV